MRKWFVGTVFAMLSISAMAADDGMIGTYEGSSNFASVMRSGSIISLNSGMRIAEGETIITSGAASVDKRAALKLDDNTVIALRQHSQFVIDKFSYRPTGENVSASDDSMVGNLVRGGLRAITGLIAKNRKEAVQYKTPTATIGIRGTDFTARECKGDCEDIGVTENGLLLQVDDGEVAVKNSDGEQTIGASEGLIAGEEGAPKLAPYIPEMRIKLPETITVGRGC